MVFLDVLVFTDGIFYWIVFEWEGEEFCFDYNKFNEFKIVRFF